MAGRRIGAWLDTQQAWHSTSPSPGPAKALQRARPGLVKPGPGSARLAGLRRALQITTVYRRPKVSSSVITSSNNLTPGHPTLNSSLAFVFAHTSSLTPPEARLLREFNQYVSITPESEMHYGHGDRGSYLIQDQASLGVDTQFTFSVDIIGQMRIWLQCTRLGLEGNGR
ncbi:hypothetical protein DFH09DRAFT_1466058 [Mycena vulgaris]|nr:hypothetical protein DFH09DRAFT_1466058 [Mycena vulgaris]